MKGIFITSKTSLEPEGGGVQRCTREYIRYLEAVGIELNILPFKSDMRLLTRIRRNVKPHAYRFCLEPGLGNRVISEIDKESPSWLFFNHCDGLAVLKEIATTVREKGTKIAFLSHGLDSTDFLHYEMPDGLNVAIKGKTKKKLGEQLFEERCLLQKVDLTCCLAPTDVEIHRWLGAERVIHLPRVIRSSPIEWNPVVGRIGTIATLVHAPNLHGIIKLCQVMKNRPKNDLRLRIVGRPESLGNRVAAEYPFVDYLAPIFHQ